MSFENNFSRENYEFKEFYPLTMEEGEEGWKSAP
jgi:hypothetical protein